MSAQSVYYTAVQNILSLIDRNTMTRFESLTTDQARFEFLSSLDYVQSAFTIKPSKESHKSSVEAARMRQRGNELYAENKLTEALQCYNRSVIMAPPPVLQTPPPTPPSSQAGSGNSTPDPRPTPAARWRKAKDAVTAGLKKAASSSGPCVVAGSCQELSLALGNRSACLLSMKMYFKCLDDIDMALAQGYPAHLRYKLYDRKGRVLLELDRLSEANEAFHCVLGQLKYATNLEQAQKDEIEASMNKKLLKGEVLPDSEDTQQQVKRTGSFGSGAISPGVTTERDPTSEIPALSCAVSERYPSASSAFDVRYNADEGRYGVATRPVTVGDVILVEQPYASVPDQESYPLRCYHCFKSVAVPYACFQCIKVRYCSEDCRIKSWDAYHSIECPLLDTLNASGTGMMSHLAMRVLVVTGLDNIIRYKSNPKTDMIEAEQALFTDSRRVFLAGFPSLYTLLSHSDSRPTTDLLQYTILSVWITKLLQKSSFFSNRADAVDRSKDSSIIALVGGIILKFLQIISCNGVEITEMTITETLPKSYPTSIGLALYPTVSLLNHACDPAMELIFYRNICVARAMRNVRVGGELTIDYGYVYYTTAKSQRQLALRSQYYFDCRCLPCTQNWGLTATLKSDVPLLRCPECFTPLPRGSAGGERKVVCGGCEVDVDPMERVAQLQHSQMRAEQCIRDARRFEMDKAIPILQSHVQLMNVSLVQPWKDYVISSSTLKQCYRMLGNRRRRTAN